MFAGLGINIAAVVSVLVATLAFGFAYYKGYSYGAEKVSAKWAEEKAILQEEYAAGLSAARKKEQDATVVAADIQKEREHASQVIATLGTALRDSLRNRPRRAAATTETRRVSEDSTVVSAQPGATGAQLYREDAESFAREAELAALVQSELRTCRAQYARIQKLYNGDTE